MPNADLNNSECCMFVKLVIQQYFVLELVEKVFLKIVLAESDDQLRSSLNGFLAPVLLKLSSRDDQVKNKVRAFL